MARKAIRYGFVVATLLVCVASFASAMDTSEAASPLGRQLFYGILGSLIYSMLGLLILLIGFKIFDKATPFSLNKEIAEDDNVAAGVVVAGIMIGLGIIVAAAIL